MTTPPPQERSGPALPPQARSHPPPLPSAILPLPPHGPAGAAQSAPAAVANGPHAVRVTVIIKAYNEQERIERALCSALLAVRELGGEVVLADSGSTDETVAIASRYPVRVVQLIDPRERSCGIGPELGWRHARGEYLYLMDGDMVLLPGFLVPALRLLAQHPEVAGVGGCVIERQLQTLEYQERQTRATQAQAHRRPGPVDRLDGGGLYRRIAIQEVGYLSDRNLHSYEEFDLAARLRARGWRLWRLPLASVAHEGHADPALRLLLRRWHSRYAWGCGELLRAALGQPWQRLVLRDLRELRLYAGVWVWAATLLGLGLTLPPQPWAAGLIMGGLMLPWVTMICRKRSVVRGSYALAAWCVHAAGLIAGLLAPRQHPRAPIAARVLREPERAPTALATSTPTPARTSESGAVSPRTTTSSSGSMPRSAGAPSWPSAARPPRADAAPEIWVACPWTPAGGGMYKVADYLIRAQGPGAGGGAGCGSGDESDRPMHAMLRPLDTRSDGSALGSLRVLALALGRLVRARAARQVAGVHVNMAERLSLVRKSVVVVSCRMLGLPVVLHLHAAQLHRAWPRLPLPARALARWVFSLPAACIVLGRQSANFVTRELRVPAARVHVVTNGVPAPVALRRGPGHSQNEYPALPHPLEPLRLLFVGNLSERKGVEDLLQALALPALASLPLTLTLAGGGDLPRWQARAHHLRLGTRVRFAGWVEGAALAAEMSQAHALVLPSHDEGLPLAILEALALGLPVVCTPVGEIPDHLQDGRHALWVPPGDPLALASALARVLQDGALRERLSQEGQALWAREFSMERFFLRIAAVHARCFGVCATLGTQGVRRP